MADLFNGWSLDRLQPLLRRAEKLGQRRGFVEGYVREAFNTLEVAVSMVERMAADEVSRKKQHATLRLVAGEEASHAD